MVDARDSKSRDSDIMSVRVRPSVPLIFCSNYGPGLLLVGFCYYFFQLSYAVRLGYVDAQLRKHLSLSWFLIVVLWVILGFGVICGNSNLRRKTEQIVIFSH